VQSLMSETETEDYPDDELLGFKFFQQGTKSEGANEGPNMLRGVIHHQGGTPISRSWILLYIQSTVDGFCNGGLLENIGRLTRQCTLMQRRCDQDQLGQGYPWLR
jgi:hypothetical protein